MNTALPASWSHEEKYRAQRAELIGLDSTLAADTLLCIPGYAPHIWLTAAVGDIVRRASTPCPKEHFFPLLRQAFAQIMHEIWSEEHAARYSGCFTSHDIIVEELATTLIVDCGEPEDCCLVAVLSDATELIAEADEFDLGPDYITDRAILRALVAQI